MSSVNMVNSTLYRIKRILTLLFHMSIHVFYRRNLVNKICQKLLIRENHRLAVRIVLLTDNNVLLALNEEMLSPFARKCVVFAASRI